MQDEIPHQSDGEGEMTDRSGWTDEQVNEAVAKCRGEYGIMFGYRFVRLRENTTTETTVPYYTHDWRLAGMLLEEMKPVDVTLMYLIQVNKWCVDWVDNMATVHSVEGDNPKRTIAEAWLMMKIGGEDEI